MDFYRLSSDIKFINQIGRTLNLDERMKLELGLMKINENERFDQVLFWGKIEGITGDYYIALCLNFLNYYEFPHKTFFYASNDFIFLEIPDFNPEYKEKIETFKTPFTGKKDTMLVQVTNPEDQAQNPDGGETGNPEELGNAQAQQQQKGVESDEEEEIKVPPKNFTELDRLAYIVRAIETDCQIVPIGSYKLTPNHELRLNEAFKGLNLQEAIEVENYQHFRNPISEDKKAFISQDDVLFKFNFFDPLTYDLPYGCWSIQSDNSKSMITIRSLVWPGYVGYHKANSRTFGGVYIGDGIKNVDLPFQLK